MRLAKITRPRVIGVLPRTRLFHLLDHASGRYPLLWISGPAGCGKTTLVASWLDYRKLSCLWYRIDAGDDDVATFFYYLGLAARRGPCGKKTALPLLTPEYSLGVLTFARRFFEKLLASPRRVDASRPVIVFDNYQEIWEDSGFHDVIAHALEVVPEGAVIAVLSRTGPPPSLSRLQAGGGVFILDWDRIRFTAGESFALAAKIAASKRKKPLPKSALRRVYERTGGWAAGIVLMMASTGESGAVDSFLPAEIFNYFASEILKKTDRETEKFLLKTAFLPDLTAAWAERLTGAKAAAEILSKLTRSHFFTYSTSDVQPLYHYHSMFRDFLLATAAKSLSSEERHRAKRTAAEILAEAGRYDSAAGLLREARDWDGLAHLVLLAAPQLSAQGRSRVVEEWIASLPAGFPARMPWLVYWLGACRMPFDPVASRRLFEKAFPAFEAAHDVPGMLLSWAGLVVSLSLSFEDIAKLEERFLQLDALMKQAREPLTAEVLLAVTSAVFFASTNLRSDVDIDEWVERGLALRQETHDVKTVTQILSNMAIYLALRKGDLRRAESVIAILRDLAHSSAAPFVQLASALAEALFRTFTGEHRACLEAVSTGLEVSASTGIHVMDFLILIQGVLSSLNTDDLETARDLLKKTALAQEGAGKFASGCFHTLLGTEALQRGAIPEAMAQTELAVRLLEDIGQPTSSAMARLVEAQILYESGKTHRAFRSLSRAHHVSRAIGSDFLEFGCLLTNAHFLFRRGEEEKALALLRKGLGAGRKQGNYFPLVWQPSAMADLCLKALENGIEPDYVRTLIQRRNLIPESPVNNEAWPYPVRIRTFGGFSLVADGRPVRFAGKVQHKPLDLLKALIAFGGAEVPETRLADALWPDAEGDLAHRAFATTLHRLRKLLRDHRVIHFVEGKVTLDPKYCWVDAWVFDRIAKAMEEAPTLQLRAQAEELLAIYRGPFLPEDSAKNWTVSACERFVGKFVHVVEKLAGQLAAEGHWKDAAACYLRGLEVDETREEFYRGLMRSYLELGRRSDALSAYRRCQRTLVASLGVTMSEETEQLYRLALQRS
ncbi:MAG: BTAD domain-containing putative transcriptional regulator [Acidobacteriota bacterium]